MSSIIPSSLSGGLSIRDTVGNNIQQLDVSNSYNPSKKFKITCSLNYLPSNCSARITPEQINAFQSEMIAFAEALTPDGKWDCDKLNNLNTSFTSWWKINKPDLSGFMHQSDKMPIGQILTTPFIPVESITLNTPPYVPEIGKAFIIPDNAVGLWMDKVNQIAEWDGKAWKYTDTQNGHSIGLSDGRLFTKVNGAYVEKVALDAQSGKWNYAEADGTGDAIIASIEPKPHGYSDGMIIVLTLKKTSTTKQPTINFNNIGACNVVNPDGSNLSVGALVANTKIVLVYDKRLNAFCALTSTKQPGQAIGFFAYGTKGATLPTGALTQVKIGPTIRFDTNESYSVDTGLFTCPFDGLYTFSFSFWFEDISLQTWVFIGLNNTMIAESSVNSRGRVLTVSTNLMLKKGDKVGTYVRQAGSTMTIPNDPKQFYYAFSAISNGV